jgi:hypothetical protein
MSGPLIDHDPEEPKKPYRPVPWWALWLIVAIGWISYASSETFDLYPIALGFLTGGILATWALEITGNKTPESWKSKSASGNRNADL